MTIFIKTIYMARKPVSEKERITRVSIWVKAKYVARATRAVKAIEAKIKKLP